MFAEVARTRLREEGSKYRKFWQTLSLVAQEEGYRGLYRGLGTQVRVFYKLTIHNINDNIK